MATLVASRLADWSVCRILGEYVPFVTVSTEQALLLLSEKVAAVPALPGEEIPP